MITARRLLSRLALACASAISCVCLAPVEAAAQDQPARAEAPAAKRAIRPYIAVNQIVTAQLSPGDDVLTFTQLAAGVDANVQSRNSGVSVSLRYERNIGYGDGADSDNLSGVARGSLAIVPRSVTLEAGALASRTRIDPGGGTAGNPLIAIDNESQIYSFFAGPRLGTQVGRLDLTASAQVGYTRIEAQAAPIAANGDDLEVFDESVTYRGDARLAARPGQLLPVGLAMTGGVFQEDITNFDQRVRDVYLRGEVIVPLTGNLHAVGGMGFESVEVSSRDVIRDESGVPLLGPDGRFLVDSSEPRTIGLDIDGFIWDVGVRWRPSSRTSLSATVGRRYASTTFFGNATWSPSSRTTVAINVYDAVTGLGGALNNSLSGVSSDFTVARNALTGDFGGLVNGADGAANLGILGSVRGSVFRNRGGQVSYSRNLGRSTASIAAGYDSRTFIAPANTIFAELDGQTDRSYYLNAALTRPVGQRSSFQGAAYANRFESDAVNSDLTAYGASLAYNRSLTRRLSARAAIAIDFFESDFGQGAFGRGEFAAATALIGLRYDF